MPQIQSKVQPTTRTQPTATTTPGGGIAENLRNALIGFFRNLYNSLTSSASFRQQFTASIYQSRGEPSGAAPLFAPPSQKRTDVFAPPQQLRTFYSTPSVSPQVQQEIERKREARRLESQLAGKKIDFSKINIQQSPTLTAPTPESTPAFLPQTKRQQTTLAGQTSEIPPQTSSKTTTSKSGTTSATTTDITGKQSEKTISGAPPPVDHITNLSQSQFAQDVQNLITPPQTTTQTVTNVPQGAEIQTFRDPLGGSTPFFGYTIRPGDTLTKIARDFGVSVEDILRLNKDKTDAIKNVPGRPFGDIIIAGKEIRIPVVQKELKQSPLLGQKVSSTDEINQKAKESLQQPQPTLNEQSLLQLINQTLEKHLEAIDEHYNQYVQLSNVNTYRQQYETLVDQLGIPETMAAIRNIESLMAKTKEDIMKEAAEAGGLVTESQVAEVLNFRQGVLKSQYDAFVDLLHEKERMLDKLMTYTRWDREDLEKMLDRELRIEEFKANYTEKILGKEWDIMKHIEDKNYKKIETEAKMGTLHTFSADYLAKLVDPTSPYYAGLSVDDVQALLRYSQQVAAEKELRNARIKQQIQNTLEQMQMRRTKEAREAQLFPWKLEYWQKKAGGKIPEISEEELSKLLQ
jgi:LysM repeat protein